MSFTPKVFIVISKVVNDKAVKLHRQESRSFTRWAKIFMANLAAAAGVLYAGEGTLTFTGLQVKDIYGVLEPVNLNYLTNQIYATACGQSDETFDEEQFFLSDFIAFADNYELLSDIALDGNTVKFSMRSYFVVVSDFTMKETVLLGIFADSEAEGHLITISRDLLETPYECKTDEVYIVDYEFVYGRG